MKQLLKVDALSPHYVLEVYRDGPLDSLDVLVEPKVDAGTSDAEKQAAAQALQQHIKSVVGISAGVKITEIGSIERSIGKAKRVIDKRQ